MKNKQFTLLTLLLALALLSPTGKLTASMLGVGTTRVSIASDGTEGNMHSTWPSISADGRYVAFESEASNLVSGDTNGRDDVFVHDRQTGQTIRVSVASDGTEGDRESYRPSASSDGRYVAFESYATNLMSGDTNFSPDVFVHDQQTGQTICASLADGTVALGSSSWPSISANGRYVAFASTANNLVVDDTNYREDIFVYDRDADEDGIFDEVGQVSTTRVSLTSGGTQVTTGDSYVPSISADGRYVAFGSRATDLVPGDTNGHEDVFLHDRQTGQTTRISVASDGTEGNGSSWYNAISADGRYVAFRSDASNLVSGDTNEWDDIFVHDRVTGQTVRISVASDGTQANGMSHGRSISGDGRYVAFDSGASNLVSGDTNNVADIFVHDRDADGDNIFDEAGQVSTTRASVASDGAEGLGNSEWPSISGDGRYVAFASYSSTLVPGDTNWVGDIFVRDRGGPIVHIYLPLVVRSATN